VAALALAPRLLFLAETWGEAEYLPLVSDTQRFQATAERLAAGDWMLSGEPYEQGPLYPYALAALYRVFGPDPRAVRVAQALLGVGTCLLLFALARRLLPAGFAAAAAALYALYGYAVFTESLLLDPSLLALLYVGIALGLARHAEDGRLGWLAATGVALGAAIATRPNAVLLAPFALAALGLAAPGRGARPRATALACLAAGALLPILPFAARNLAVGQPALHLSSQGRKVFVASNVPDSPGAGWVITPQAEEALAAPGAGAIAAVARGALEHPGGFALLQLRKLHALFASYEIPNVANFYLWRERSRWLTALPVGIHAIAALALPGVALCLRRREARIPLLLAAGAAATVLPFYVIARFRMPLVPFLCLFAGATLEAALAALRRRELRRAAVLAAGVALAALATTSPVRDRIEPGSHRSLGALYEQAGRLDAAAVEYRRALAKRAGFARAAEDLVCLELGRGRFAEAAEAARLHLAARPDNAHAQRLLEVAQRGALPAEPFSCRREWDVDPHRRPGDAP
jgi:4-amino-4-deoxy-L-arabinose transferase-like glycosyltransferase